MTLKHKNVFVLGITWNWIQRTKNSWVKPWPHKLIALCPWKQRVAFKNPFEASFRTISQSQHPWKNIQFFPVLYIVSVDVFQRVNRFTGHRCRLLTIPSWPPVFSDPVGPKRLGKARRGQPIYWECLWWMVNSWLTVDLSLDQFGSRGKIPISMVNYRLIQIMFGWCWWCFHKLLMDESNQDLCLNMIDG